MRSRTIRLGALAVFGAGLLGLMPASALAATADLAVDKVDGNDSYSSDPVNVGDEITYTITVTNLGPDAANGVELVDDLANQLDFVSSNPSQGSCKGTKKVTCTLGTIADGGSATVTIKVKPKRAGQVVNNVSVSGADTDPVSANNTDTETTTVIEPATVLCGGKEATVIGTDGNDTLTGTNKRDVFAAFGGDDVILGLGGNDLVCGAGGNDTIKGAGGNDSVRAGGGDDFVKGGVGADALRGKAGNDLIKGGSDNDLLRGGGGNDSLGGGSGDDELRGGGGSDSCKGGPGRDTRRSC